MCPTHWKHSKSGTAHKSAETNKRGRHPGTKSRPPRQRNLAVEANNAGQIPDFCTIAWSHGRVDCQFSSPLAVVVPVSFTVLPDRIIHLYEYVLSNKRGTTWLTALRAQRCADSSKPANTDGRGGAVVKINMTRCRPAVFSQLVGAGAGGQARWGS